MSGDSFSDTAADSPTLGSAGSLGTPSSSRARMLAQQREIQLKNRQKSMESAGEIRQIK